MWGAGEGIEDTSLGDETCQRKRELSAECFSPCSELPLPLILVAAVAVIVVLRGPLPRHSGEVILSGPRAEIRMLRDHRAVPHIYATTDHDLFFAQGYVHAQERFFQMDLSRHMALGRLEELVGESGKESDITVRTMGWRQVAEKEWELLSDEARGFYEAYLHIGKATVAAGQ